MPDKLLGILVCLLLANVVNYALGEWMDAALSSWVDSQQTTDGSSLYTSAYYGAVGVDPEADAARKSLLQFYNYLEYGGAPAYLEASPSLMTDGPASLLLDTALGQAAATNKAKYLSLILLVIASLLLWGKGLREEKALSPIFYFLIVATAVALYGGLLAPFAFLIMMGGLVIYLMGLLSFLPIYRTEWTRMMRPMLMLTLFILATMAWRGQELVDYWFWTSPLYRLSLVYVLLLSVYFHFLQVDRALAAAKMTSSARVFAIGFPLGVTAIFIVLTVGLYGADAGAGLGTINQELTFLPVEFIISFNPDAPFTLFFAGATVLILAGIGYYVQRIAQ